MQAPLLQTKLYIPPPPPAGSLVPRQRLLDRLNQGLQGKLTLLSAPAGSGKTTLISNWIYNLRLTIDEAEGKSIENRKSKIENNVTWLSLDEGDNDLARFLRYIIAALDGIEAGIGYGVQAMLQGGGADPLTPEVVLTTLINEISVALAGSACILVLDDYHFIESAEIHQAMVFFIDHMPPQLHLVLTSRSDPPFPLSRWRVRRQVTEVGAAELRFTVAEATAFLNDITGLNLAEAEVQALETRTEGWIAGLQLAALSMQARSSPGEKQAFIQAFKGHSHYAEVIEHALKGKDHERAVGVFLALFSTPISQGSSQTILQSKVEPQIQGRVFALRG